MGTKEMLLQFAIENEQRRQETDAREREENDKIEAYARMKREHEERLAAEKERLEEEKRRVLGEMIGKQMAANKEAEELEQLRNDLHFQELEAEHRRREELQVRKKLEDRVEMMRAYESQMQLKEEKKKMDREEEDKFREQLMAKFAEDDRIEQLNDQKRRMKIQKHKKEVERLIKEKQAMYELEREAEVEEQRKGREEEARRHTIVSWRGKGCFGNMLEIFRISSPRESSSTTQTSFSCRPLRTNGTLPGEWHVPIRISLCTNDVSLYLRAVSSNRSPLWGVSSPEGERHAPRAGVHVHVNVGTRDYLSLARLSQCLL